MVVEESIHVIFDESNNSLQERESFDDDLGLETSMRKLKIEDKRQQEESGEDPKKEESPLALPPPQQVQGESSQDLPKDWKFVINHPQDQIIGNPSSGCMHSEFEMSMMGELNFFLGLQIKQLKEGTFINQAKYIKDLLKRFNMEEAKVMKTPMSSSIKLDMDEKDKPSKGRSKEKQRENEENRGQQLQSSFTLLEHFPKFYNKKRIYDPIDYACIDETDFWVVDDDQPIKLDVEELENLLYEEGSIPINEVEGSSSHIDDEDGGDVAIEGLAVENFGFPNGD
ncbi:hypothetical protein CK203_025495 [Vitis vinifera]|uniref:Reverse transcriptase Ty1/copia-type domain-containing protein n=1 Tax=Vitis vinifera TaxID=29760 RepID=A0A438IFD4_VITVI|nr:hypothetical protein CK203_025495 [Vitis vinifera]